MMSRSATFVFFISCLTAFVPSAHSQDDGSKREIEELCPMAGWSSIYKLENGEGGIEINADGSVWEWAGVDK